MAVDVRSVCCVRIRRHALALCSATPLGCLSTRGVWRVQGRKVAMVTADVESVAFTVWKGDAVRAAAYSDANVAYVMLRFGTGRQKMAWTRDKSQMSASYVYM